MSQNPDEESASVPDPGAIILALEQAKEGVAALTEMRQQFIDAGWSDQGAESMVYVLTLNAKGGR